MPGRKSGRVRCNKFNKTVEDVRENKLCSDPCVLPTKRSRKKCKYFLVRVEGGRKMYRKQNCNICKAVHDKEGTKFIVFYSDDNFAVLKSLKSQVRYHYIIAPREHMTQTSFIADTDMMALIGKVILRIKHKVGFDNFRLVLNYGKDAGQTEQHAHFLIGAGKKMKSNMMFK